MLQVLACAESEKSCSVSATHSPALWHCFDCDRSLCDECLKNHSTFTKDHQVLSLSDVKTENLECIIRRESPCKIHLNHTFEFFCKDCDVLICPICLKDDHKDHKTLTLQEVTAIKKDSLSKNLEEIEKLESKDMEKKQQEEISISMIGKAEKAKKEVQKMTKKLVKFLLDQEQQLLNEIQESIAKAERNLHIILHTPAAKEYIKSIMANGIASAGDMVDYSNKFTYDPFKSNTSGIVFCPNENLSEQVMSVELGHVRYSSKSNSILSEIQIDSDLKALAKAKLYVVTKTSAGALNYDDSDVVDIEISPENDVKVEKPMKTDGKIEVEFMPRVPGQLTANVELNGIRVSNRPLEMDIEPQCIEEIKDSKLNTALNTGSGYFSGIAVNKTNSRIAVIDQSLHCVRVFTMDGELLVMYGGEGSEPGQLLSPQELSFLNETDVVIAEWNNHRISIVNTSTGTLVKTFGSYGNGNGELNNPFGVHVDDDCNIIVCDSGNSRVQVFTKDGDYQYQFTVPNQDNFTPNSIVTHNGLFYVSDWKNGVIHVIQMKDDAPTQLSTIGEMGDGVGQLQRPRGLAIDNDNNLLVCDKSNVLTKFTLDGRVVGHVQTTVPNHYSVCIIILNDGQIACTFRERVSSKESRKMGFVKFYQN